MNGLDFDYRVLRPWANNPAFYVTVLLAREGPLAYGAVELWTYAFPLTSQQAELMDAGIRVIPKLLDQAKVNLIGNGRALWVYGATSIRKQSGDLEQLAARLGDAAGNLAVFDSAARPTIYFRYG